MLKTLEDGTVINMNFVTMISPLMGDGDKASYEVYIKDNKHSMEVLESYISRETFLADLATVVN